MSEKRAVIDFSLILCDAQVSQQLLLFLLPLLLFFHFANGRYEDMRDARFTRSRRLLGGCGEYTIGWTPKSTRAPELVTKRYCPPTA